jgi:hypothetical protein
MTDWIKPVGSEAQPGSLREALAAWFGAEQYSTSTEPLHS